LVTIGNDLKCHLWSEDATQPPQQGHRFRRVATIQSTPRVPFVSLDVKTLTTDHVTTFLALIDRLGLLSVYEPSNPDDLREWTLLDSFNVCAPNAAPSRGDETSFKVRFDPNPTPLPYIASVCDERDQLGLVVCALNEVKIFRGVVPSATGAGTGGGGDASIGGIGLGIGGGSGVSSTGGGSHRIMFHEAIKLPVHPALVRDVAWAPFSVRGTDRIATACKDGGVRVFELGVAEGQNANGNDSGNGNGGPNGTEHQRQSAAQARNTVQQRLQQQSSLTSAITGRQSQASSTQLSSQPGSSRTGYDFGYLTTLSSFTTLPQAHTDAWSVIFDGQGQVLLSQGSDGVTKLWRKSVLNGQWMVFAGQDITEDSDESDEDDDDDEEVNEKLGALNL
jgi:nucleoporin SEH1